MEKVEGEIAQLGLPVLGELTKLSVNIRESMEFKVSYNSSAGADGAGGTLYTKLSVNIRESMEFMVRYITSGGVFSL